MKTTTLILAGVFALGISAPLDAQEMRLAEPSAAMKKIAAMVGEWRGTSWFMLPGGKRVNVDSWENVDSKLGGLALFVEGRHTSLEKADSGRVVHHAAGMIFFDQATQQLTFTPVMMDGRTTDTWMTVTAKGIDWGFDLPNGVGKVKYETDLSTPGVWIETGFFSRDGQQWFPTLQLNLKKVEQR